MRSQILRSLFATRKLIDPSKRRSTFELFGYDFIIDEDFNLWLIEVNTNPCLEESSELLKMLLPRAINDMLKLSIDPYYGVKCPDEYAPQVIGYEDTENMWDFLV